VDPAPGNNTATALLSVRAVPIEEIPTLDGAGLAILVASLALAGLLGLRRRLRSGTGG